MPGCAQIAFDQRLHLDVARRTIRKTLAGELPIDTPIEVVSWVLDNVLQQAPGFETPLRAVLEARRPFAGLDTEIVTIPADELHDLLAQADELHSVEPKFDLAGVA